MSPHLDGIRTLDQLKSLSAEQLQRLLQPDGAAKPPPVPEAAGKPCEARRPRLTVKSLPRRATCAAGEDCDGLPWRSR